MTQDLKIELAALQKMSPSQLREKYLHVFGESTRSGNTTFLCKRIAWRLQSNAEGSLSERARQRAVELARDADIRTTMPKPPKTNPTSFKQVEPLPVSRNERLPMPGAVLSRQYKGRRIDVSVLPNGFEWEGKIYRSLSGIAKLVTGSHWNGLLFFGLKKGGAHE